MFFAASVRCFVYSELMVSFDNLKLDYGVAVKRSRQNSDRLTKGVGFLMKNMVEELERGLILRASYATKWNQSRTADVLNLKRDKLRYRMRQHGIAFQREAA